MAGLLLVLFLALGARAADESARTWTDATGQFHVKATLLRVDGENVHLQRADGRELTVKISQLSTADQSYLKSVMNPFGNERAPTGTAAEKYRDSVVVVWVGINDRPNPCQGIVVRRDGDKAFIVAQLPGFTRQLYAKMDPTCQVLIYANGKARRQSAKVIAHDPSTGRLVANISAAVAPVAIPLRPAVRVTEGMPVYIAGFELASGAAARVWEQGTVKRLFTDSGGTIAHMEIQSNETRKLRGALVVSTTGVPVGITTGNKYVTWGGEKKIWLTATPIAKLADFDRPVFGESFGVARTDAAGKRHYEFVVHIIDPFQQIRAAKIHVKRSDAIRQMPHLLPGEQFRRSVIDGGKELVLTRSTPTQDTIKALGRYYSPTQPTWIAHYTLSPEKQQGFPKAFLTQCCITDKKGKKRFGAPRTVTVRSALLNPANVSGRPMPTAPHRAARPHDARTLTWAGTRVKAGTYPFRKSLTPNNPRPRAERKKLAGPPYVINNAPAIALDVDASNLVPDLIWSDDGKRLFLLKKNGLLRQVSVPDFEQLRVLDLESQCRSMTRSSQGLVIATATAIVIVDARTLAVRGVFPIPHVVRVASVPKLSVAYALDERFLYVLDLKKHAVVHQVPRNTWSRIRVTPNAKYLLLVSWQLVRCRIDGTELIKEQDGVSLGSHYQRIFISPDSTLVALPCGGGNRGVPGFESVRYGTLIFPIMNLTKPVVVLRTGAYPRCVAMDPKTGNFYAQNLAAFLIVLSKDGVQQKIFSGASTLRTRLLVPHPDGQKLLVLGESALIWLRLDITRKPTRPVREQRAKKAGTTQRADVEQRPPPKPAPIVRSLQQNVQHVGKATIVEIDLAGNQLAGMPVWSPRGNRFFVLEKNGRLRTIDSAHFTQTVCLDFNTRCAAMALSAQGLLVAASGSQELMVVQPNSLAVVKSIVVPKPNYLATAPTLNVAFVASGDRRVAALSIVDVKRGQIVSQQDTIGAFNRDQKRLTPGIDVPVISALQHFAVTPNGKYLLNVTYVRVTIFAVDRSRLVYRATCPVRTNHAKYIATNSDGRLFAVPCPGGNRMDKEIIDRTKKPVTFVFSVQAPDRPDMALPAGETTTTLGFDYAAPWIYSHKRWTPLVVFDRQGKKLLELTSSRAGQPATASERSKQLDRFYSTQVLWLVPDPKGHSLLIVGKTKTWWVKLPSALP